VLAYTLAFPGLEKRVAGRFRAFLGLWRGRAMLAGAGKGVRCLFSLDESTVLCGHTVCKGVA